MLQKLLNKFKSRPIQEAPRFNEWFHKINPTYAPLPNGEEIFNGLKKLQYEILKRKKS